MLLLPFFITGKHPGLRITKVFRCKRVRIKASDMTFQMDGELRGMNDADIRIVPGGLSARY